MSGPRKNTARIIGAALAVVGLGLIAWTVPFDAMAGALRRANFKIIAWMAVLYAACLMGLSTRFWLLLRAACPVDFASVVRVTLVGQLASAALPSAAGADVARVGALVAARSATITTAVAAALLDRAVGLTTLASMGLLLGLWRGGIVLTAGAIGLATVPCGFVVLLAIARLLPPSALERLPSRARKIAGDVRAYLDVAAGPRALASAFAASVVTSGLQLIVYRGLLAAVGATPISETKTFVGTALAFVTAALPGLPGGIGTADAAFALLLEPAGVARADAFAAFLLFRGLWYTSAAIGGVVYATSPTRAS